MSQYHKTIDRGQNSVLVTREVAAGDLEGGWAGVSIRAVNDPGVLVGYRVIDESGAGVDYELHMAFSETNDVDSKSMELRESHSGSLDADGDTGRVNISDDQPRGIVLRVNGATDPITAKYDALLDYDPIVLLPMDGAAYTSYRGQQLFFQDPAGTTPAVDVGDPVGAVVDLVTGEIKAVQTDDASRPVLGAEGIIFDGSSTSLRFPFTTSGGYTAIIALKPDALSADATQRFLSSYGLNRQFRYSSGVPELATSIGSISHGLSVDAASHVLGYSVLSGDSAIYSTQHGVTTDASSVSDDLDGIDIGRFAASGIYYDGSISAAALFDSRLSNGDLETACKILEATL